MSNVFAAGPLIINRLATGVTGLEDVMWASSAIGPNAENMALPIAMLQPGQAQGNDDSDESDKTRESQLWQVGLRVPVNPAATVSGSAEVAMGELIYDTIVTLRGWRHGVTGMSPLSYVSRTEMQYPAGSGAGEVWLTFDAVTVTRRT